MLYLKVGSPIATVQPLPPLPITFKLIVLAIDLFTYTNSFIISYATPPPLNYFDTYKLALAIYLLYYSN